MKITFLGTGTSQGVPVIGCSCPVCLSLDFRDKRLRCSVHIEVEGQSIVIDTGPDFRQQMLRENIQKLDAVLFTHSHKDHTAGLDDVRPFNFKQGSSMPLYGSPEVLEQLKVEYFYAFSDNKYPGIPKLDLNEINTEVFTVNGISITPLPVMHLHLPVLGFRIGNFGYITDTNLIPQKTLGLLKNLDVLVLNALQIEKHVSHFNLEEAIAMANQINANQTYFTHISHKLGVHHKIQKELPETIALAFDGLSLQI